MKNSAKMIAGLALSLLFTVIACDKNKSAYTEDFDSEVSNMKEDISLMGDGLLEKVVVKRLVKPDDCRFIVSGTIEYRLDGVVVAIVDYGNGACDNVATKTVRGTTTRFLLEPEGNNQKYKKIITEPLVRLENCDYIVSGIIEFHQNESWVATLDYGDGNCDNIAIKYWDGGQKEITLDK